MSQCEDIQITVNCPDDIEAIQSLWREYWTSVRLAPDFQGFSEEVQNLPGMYAAPRGRLLLARLHDQPAGTAAFRPLNTSACEAKRLYVRPTYRGKGIGNALLARLVHEARHAGYKEMFGDTLTNMKAAIDMYTQLGFSEVAPYSPNPTPGAIYLRFAL